MQAHDPFDDFEEPDELRALRVLHQHDRMPADLRERVLRRAGLARPLGSGARTELAGHAHRAELAALAAPAGLARLTQKPLAARHAPVSSSALPVPLGGPVSGRKRARATGLLLGAGAGLLAAAGLALWLGPTPLHLGVEPQRTPLELEAREYGVDELRALGARPGVSEVRVVGALVQGSLKRLPPLPPHRPMRCGFHFHLRAPDVSSGEGIHVEYARCRAPDGLVDDPGTCVEVTALGRLMRDGRIDASRITPRRIACPH